MSLTDLVEEYKGTVKSEFPSSIATLIAYSPFKAIAEKGAEMTTSFSILLRTVAIPVTCIEIPTLLYLRKYYHVFMGNDVNPSQERVEKHDKMLSFGVSVPLNILYYRGMGEGWGKGAIAAFISAIIGAFLVKPALYTMDVAKDLMGYQTIQEARIKRGTPKELSHNKYMHDVQKYIRDKSLEFEDWLSKQSTYTKKKGLALMIAGSIAVTSLVYVVYPKTVEKPVMIEAVSK